MAVMMIMPMMTVIAVFDYNDDDNEDNHSEDNDIDGDDFYDDDGNCDNDGTDESDTEQMEDSSNSMLRFLLTLFLRILFTITISLTMQHQSFSRSLLLF